MTTPLAWTTVNINICGLFFMLVTTAGAFQPILRIQQHPQINQWPTTLSSARVNMNLAPSVTASSRSLSLTGDDDKNSNKQDMSLFSSSPFATYDLQMKTLFYLSDASSIPPQTRELFAQLSQVYISNLQQRPVTLEQVLQVIEAEHIPLDVPIQLDETTIDVKQTGDEIDESVAEIFSLAAMYALPKAITLQLLDSCILSAQQGESKSELELCRRIFKDKGWQAVSFPKGLALQVMKQYERPEESRAFLMRPFALLQRQKRRIQQAQQAVVRASQGIAPEQQRKSREEILQTIERELISDSSFTGRTHLAIADANKHLFFPKNNIFRQGFRKLTRLADKQYARLKSSGRAGIVSYCFLNLVFYTVGVLWQWNRMAMGDPLTAPSLTGVMLRKMGKVFASLYVASQFVKLPKVVAAVALTPVAQRVLNATKKQLRVSETTATVVLVGLQYLLWLGIVIVPVLSEYSKLQRVVNLDRIVDIGRVVPAFYTVNMGMKVLLEC
jgi:hypothetical protein